MREFKCRPGYTLYADTLTMEQLRDFWDYMENEHLYFRDICYASWYRQFHIEAKPPQRYTTNHKMSVLKHIKTFMNWMLDNGYTDNEAHKAFSLHRDTYAPPIYLTLAERDKVFRLDLTKHPRLQAHRDLFVFQCMVGCRIGDLFRFTVDNVKDGWLEYYPSKSMGNGLKKTTVPLVRVPLCDKAKTILERYSGYNSDKLFPIYSEALYNCNIKMILLLAGIDRLVWARAPETKDFAQMPLYEAASSHTARKTFIANLYKQVKDPELIATMTGHAVGSRAFARYLEITDETKGELVELID